jgi:type IV secretion system protein VirB10
MSDAAIDPRDGLAARDVRPVVTPPRGRLTGAVIALIAGTLAIGLFLLLNARRHAIDDARNAPARQIATLPVTPPLAVPPAPPPPPPPAPVVIREPAPGPPPIPRAPVPPPVYTPPPTMLPGRSGPPGGNVSAEPALVVDLTTGQGAQPIDQATRGPEGQAQLAGGDEAVRATLIRNRGSLIPQGTIIAAVLETPLDSNRPGLARAIVSRDARSFDGTRVLIPRGSRLIGEFRVDNNPGQRRILVTWNRLIRPDGVAIRIASPAADRLGGTGIPGRVNTHFFQRFANAVLQSALTIGVNIASRPRAGSVYVGIPNQVSTATQSLLPEVNPRPTIKVKAGGEVSIFVARDLDFGGTPPVR